MAWSTVISICCVFVISCLTQSQSQFIPAFPVPYQVEKTHAVSLSGAPVGFYSKTKAFGGGESAVSLGGAPVGLYGKRHSSATFASFPAYYAQPAPYAGYVPEPRRPGRPFRPYRRRPYVWRPRSGRPFRPPFRPPYRRPFRPPYRGPFGPRDW